MEWLVRVIEVRSALKFASRVHQLIELLHIHRLETDRQTQLAQAATGASDFKLCDVDKFGANVRHRALLGQVSQNLIQVNAF
jgi:hypothetical protein